MIRVLGWLRAALSCAVSGYLLALAWAAPLVLVVFDLVGGSPLERGHALVLAIVAGPATLLVGTVLATKRVLTELSAHGLVAADDATVLAVAAACTRATRRVPSVWTTTRPLERPVTLRGLRCAYVVLPPGPPDTEAIVRDLRSGRAAAVPPALLCASARRSWLAATRMLARPWSPRSGMQPGARLVACWLPLCCLLTAPATALAWVAERTARLLVPRGTLAGIDILADAPAADTRAAPSAPALLFAVTALLTALVSSTTATRFADTQAWPGEVHALAPVIDTRYTGDDHHGYLADLGSDHVTTVRVGDHDVTLPASDRDYAVGDHVEVAIGADGPRDLAGRTAGYLLVGGAFVLLLVLLAGWLTARSATALAEIRAQDEVQRALRATGVRPDPDAVDVPGAAGRLDGARIRVVAPSWIVCFVIAIGGAWLGERIGDVFGDFDARRIGFFAGFLVTFVGLVAFTLWLATRQSADSVTSARRSQRHAVDRRSGPAQFVQEPAR